MTKWQTSAPQPRVVCEAEEHTKSTCLAPLRKYFNRVDINIICENELA